MNTILCYGDSTTRGKSEARDQRRCQQARHDNVAHRRFADSLSDPREQRDRQSG